MEGLHEENAKKFFAENTEFEKTELPTRQFTSSYTLDRKFIFPEEYCDIARRDYFYYNADKYKGGKLPRGRKNVVAFEMYKEIDYDPRSTNKFTEAAVNNLINDVDKQFLDLISKSADKHFKDIIVNGDNL